MYLESTRFLIEILARLPPRTIAHCLAVCKAWRSAVSAPTFHRTRADRTAAVVAKVTARSVYCRDYDIHRLNEATDLPEWILSKYCTNCDVVLLDSFRGRWYRGNVHRTPPSPLGLAFPTGRSIRYRLVLGSWDGVLCVERGAPPIWGLLWKSYGN
uniref:F-box domain-containing protein n=1 Tax=Leersia perrieri TaxID=77586 RepID=A0A0D9WYX4_9ORYZ